MEEKLELAKLYFVSNRPEDSIKMLLDMIKVCCCGGDGGGGIFCSCFLGCYD